MEPEYNLDYLTSYGEFQEAPIDQKLRTLDNFSDRMFQGGNLEEARKAQEYRAQIETENVLSAPESQMMGDIYTGLMGSYGENETEARIGPERFKQMSQHYGQRLTALEQPGNIIPVDDGYVYAKKNPFGAGTLLEYEGGTRFLSDEEANPNTIPDLVRADNLPTVKKSEIYRQVVDQIGANYEENVVDEAFVPRLMSDSRFQALPIGDQRQVLRDAALRAKNNNDQASQAAAKAALSEIDSWQRQASFAPEAEQGNMAAFAMPWMPVTEGHQSNWFATAVDRGLGRWSAQWSLRNATGAARNAIALRESLTPEQLQTLDDPGTQEILWDTIRTAGTFPQAEVTQLLKDTPLAGRSPEVIEYLRNVNRYEKNQDAYDLRTQALTLIPTMQGMQEFQANQTAMEERGAGTMEKIALTARDLATNPLDVVASATLESFTSQPLSLAASAALFAVPGGQGAGAAIGMAAFRGAGMGVIGATAEGSYAWTQALDEHRRNEDGTLKPIEDILQDPKAIEEINRFAIDRGATIGVVEGVTGFILPGAMNQLDRFMAAGVAKRYAATKTADSALARGAQVGAFNVVELGAQGVAEGAGELLASLKATGEASVGDVMMEMAAGAFGPDAVAMYQAPEQFARANQEVDLAETVRVNAERMKAQADALVEGQTLAPDAVVNEGAQTGGVYSKGLVPQIEIGPTDSMGMADIEVYVEEEAIDSQPLPIAEAEGLTEVQPDPNATPEVQVQEEVGVMQEQAVEATETPVEAPVTPEPTTVTPEPAQAPQMEQMDLGDVVWTGNDYYRYVGNGQFITGYRNQDGFLTEDTAEPFSIGMDKILRNENTRVYSKADFDTVRQRYNDRENASPQDRFTPYMEGVPLKGEQGAAQGIVEQQEAPTETPVAQDKQAEALAPVALPEVAKKRTPMFKLRAHADTVQLLKAGVERFNGWMANTRILEQDGDYIRYAKDGRIQEAFRTQQPETFDDLVSTLTREDRNFRDAVEPQKWTEVPEYQELAKFLKGRVARSPKARQKTRNTKGILQEAQIDSILQGLFVQDRAAAAFIAARFGLYTPNASLIQVSDVAKLRYGNIKSWTANNARLMSRMDPMKRVLELGVNASVEDVFHELYHDFLNTLAPLVLNTAQYTRLQGVLEKRLQSPTFQAYLQKNYKLTGPYEFYDAQGNISVAAHEAFAQMMTRWHLDGKTVPGLKPQDQSILTTITQFFQQTFQDLGRTPIATATDDAHDLLSNFWVTPPPLRRKAFTPERRRERVDDAIMDDMLTVQQMAAVIAGEEIEDTDLPAQAAPLPAPPQTLADKMAQKFRMGKQPREGVPFSAGGRSLVIEGDQVFEIVGGLKLPREVQDLEWDGQSEFPQEGASVLPGTTELTDETVNPASAPEPAKKPIKRVRKKNPDNKEREVLIDTDTGVMISDKPAKRKRSGKTYDAPQRRVRTVVDTQDKDLTGVPPEKILRMSQGSLPTVSLIVDELDKEISIAASRWRARGRNARPSTAEFTQTSGRLQRERGMTEEEARVYILDRADRLKEIARSQRHPEYEVIVDVEALERGRTDPPQDPLRGALYNRPDTTDSDYLQAVEQGQTRKAAQIVEEAAREAGYSDRVFHGTRSNWTVWSPEMGGGLINTVDSPFVAETYSQADGGGRTTEQPWIVDDSGTRWKPEGDEYVSPSGERMPLDEAERLYQSGYVMPWYPSGRVMRLFGKAENTLDLTTTQGIDVLATLTPNSRGGENVVRGAKLGYFNWPSTKQEASMQHWRTDLVPQLQALGYDSIYFTDDRHRTLAFFQPNQIKSAEPIVRDENGDIIPPSQRFNPESDSVPYNVPDEENYKLGRMNTRITSSGKFAVSNMLMEIARENDYKEVPVAYIEKLVEARIASHNGNIWAQLRDIYQLTRKSPTALAAIFDPDGKQPVGLASFHLYCHATQTMLNQVALAQEQGFDVAFDINDTQLLLEAIQKRLIMMDLEMGRGINISKGMLTFAPDMAINYLKASLIGNNPAFKRYIRKALDFAKKNRKANLNSEQLDAALKEAGISPIFKKAMRNYLYNKKMTIRDFQQEAAAAWAKDKSLTGFIRPGSEENIKRLSAAYQSAESAYVKSMYAQMAHLAIESERGTAVIDSINAMFYNTILTAFSTAGINMAGSASQYFTELISFYGSWTAQDMVANQSFNPEVAIKNLEAILYGLQRGLQSIPQGTAEASGILFSGHRGNSVEAFEQALGAISTTQTLLFARPGTDMENRKAVTTLMRRVLTIMLTDVGRRMSTAPDAFWKIAAENTLIGAELYRDGWDSWQAEKPTSLIGRPKWIAQQIEQGLGLKSLEQYQQLADKEIEANGELIMRNSVSILGSDTELKVLRNLVAFNLRREDMMGKLDAELRTDARRYAYGTSFSNETRGVFNNIEKLLKGIATLGPWSSQLGRNSRTNILQIGGTKKVVDGLTLKENPLLEFRWRWGAGGAIAPFLMPFSGNAARMLEVFANWTPLGVLNQTITNRNYPDTYTELEVTSSYVKAGLGTGAVITLSLIMGLGDDDEDPERGLTGHRDKSAYGRNGQEYFVPGYSFWWKSSDGDIKWIDFSEYPQLLAMFGATATLFDYWKRDPEMPLFGLLLRMGSAAFAPVAEMGAFDAIIDLAKSVETLEETGKVNWDAFGKQFDTNKAKFARNYLLPLNRLQKELMGFERGYENVAGRGNFWATFAANTYIEGTLSEEQHQQLDRIMGPDGKPKVYNFAERFGGIIKQPSDAMLWMMNQGYVIQRSDMQRPIAGLFSKKAQKERAEEIFSTMNNGMFFVEHASEIERRASDYYWPWLEEYQNNQERLGELTEFTQSRTNQLKKEQGMGYKDIRSLQQSDINEIVRAARDIASLEVAAEYYTENASVRQWVSSYAALQARKGYKLPSYRTNRRLEQREP